MTLPYGLLTDPSAIRRLLAEKAAQTTANTQAPPQGLMAPPMPVPTQPMPTPNPDPSAHVEQGGVRGGLMHLLGTDRVTPELGALLTPDQRERVKGGLLSTAWTALTTGRGAAAQQDARAMRLLDLEDRKKARDLKARQDRLWANVQQIASGIRDPQERLDYVARMSASLGLPQGEQASLASQRTNPREFAPQRETWVTKPMLVNGKQQMVMQSTLGQIIDPTTGADLRQPGTTLAPVPLPDQFTAISGGETENGTVPILGTRSGTVRDTGIPVKESAGVGSALNMAARARLSAAIAEMNNADQGMHEFEAGLANGTIKISAPAQLLGRFANAFTHDDPISQLTQSGALAALNRTDPDLARYIRRGLSFAEGESMISQRPSDFRTKMAAFLSTAASGASPEMIADISGRRSAILTPLNEQVTNADATKRPAPTKPLNVRIAELKAEGKSRDEALAILKREGYNP